MTNASALTLEQTFRALTELTWPVPEAGLPHLVDGIGWMVTSTPGSRHFRADTTLAVNRPGAAFSCHDGQLTSITFRTSDVVPDDVPGRADTIADAFAATVDAARQVLGAPTRQVKSREPEAGWELANGGRLTVLAVESSVSAVLHSAEYADVLRRLSG